MPSIGSQELLVQTQLQPPQSPVPTSYANGQTSAPSPVSESSVRNVAENDLLGLSLDPQDDDDTAPSSSDETPVYTVEGDVQEDQEDDGIYADGVRPLIYGYLHKLGRNGKWQKRFFETDGESLSYYRSEKRTKQLAALDLKKVGTICVSAEDPTGCTFFIQVAGRPYSLRTTSNQSCIDWVITLNRVKEARLQVGGVKLVTPRFADADVAPRVVLQANRPRTRAVDNQHEWRQMTETQVASTHTPTALAYETLSSSVNLHLTQWHKPRNTYYRVKHKVIRWARSIRKLAASCSNPHDQVMLDSHLHPPGHDDFGLEKVMEAPVTGVGTPRYLD